MQIALPVALGQVSTVDDGEATGSPFSSGESSGEAFFTLGPDSGTTPDSEPLALGKALPLAVGERGVPGDLRATTEPVDISGQDLPRAVGWIGDTEAAPVPSLRDINEKLLSASRLFGGPIHGGVPTSALLRSEVGRVPGEVAKSPRVLPPTGVGHSGSVAQSSGAARDAGGNAGLVERIMAGAGGNLAIKAAERKEGVIRPSTGQQATDAELIALSDRSTLAAKSKRVPLARGAGEGASRSGFVGTSDATPGSPHSLTGAVEGSAPRRTGFHVG